MDKFLIINADDFGMCHAHNAATIELFKCGGITSATIMAPCPWALEAAFFAKENPQYAIGIHLTTTSEWKYYKWTPVSLRDTASLCDEHGYMFNKSEQFTNEASIDEVKCEIIAQIEKLKNLGFEPSHIDNHMGTLYGIENGRFDLLSLMVETACMYGLPLRFPGSFPKENYKNKMLDIKIPSELLLKYIKQFSLLCKDKKVAMIDYLVPGDWNGSQKDSFNNFREYIYELYRTFKEGVTETYIHPAIECDELKSITGSWERRVWEYKLFSDPMTRQHIESLDIKLINYRDLKKIRGYYHIWEHFLSKIHIKQLTFIFL